MSKVIRSPCNLCKRETEHDVLDVREASDEGPNGEVSSVKSYALRCRGCRDYSARIEQWYFDGYFEGSSTTLTRVEFQPARLWAWPPDWIGDLEALDSDLFGLLTEIYSAANDEQVRLLSMGTRTALDHLMNVVLGADYGPFEKKLTEMVAQGHLTGRQKDELETVIDAGSASSHRAFRPPRQLIQAMLATMEGLVQNHYITGPMLKTAASLIPPRPPRQRR
ncbi:DUF4145 domain-containing protein [Bradyrhizobium sp. AUGA SZCCT0176]|uniref:DUF4145 domain-containing protein n=1 Tax=Bradyrhizobium sp. AUGA SZCCT0176 TaxID=2807664 RepID=UPI00390CAEAA